jgi:hypothetical protein
VGSQGKENSNRSGREEQSMQRLVGLFLICLTTFAAFCQSTTKYQVGTVTEVKVHHTAGSTASDAVGYDVSVKVGDSIYVVLYTPAMGEETVKYAAGRDLLVLVGKNKITYNDILGQSHSVPIESQKNTAKPKLSKSVSPPAE